MEAAGSQGMCIGSYVGSLKMSIANLSFLAYRSLDTKITGHTNSRHILASALKQDLGAAFELETPKFGRTFTREILHARQ